MSLKARLLIAVITLVVLNILIMGISAVNVAVSKAENLQYETSRANLQNQANTIHQLLSVYFTSVENHIRSKSDDISMIEAVRGFIPGFNGYETIRGKLTEQQQTRLQGFYENEIAAAIKETNRADANFTPEFLTRITVNGAALQHDYLVTNNFPLEQKGRVVSSGVTASYDSAHRKFHPGLKSLASQFNYDDIIIADVLTGNIVYSSSKHTDFATSILDSRYHQSGISRVFAQAVNAQQSSDVFFSEYSAYSPSFGELKGFVASPVYANGEPVAVLIFKLSLAPINELLTHQGKWQERGLGQSGETILLNQQGRLLTEPRGFLENRVAYMARFSEPDKAMMSARQSAVGVQAEQTEDVLGALGGNQGFVSVSNSRSNILSAFLPLDVGNTRLAIIARMDQDEALQGVEGIRNGLIASSVIQMIVQVVIACFVAMWFAGRLVKPLTSFADTCEALAKGEGDLTIQLIRSDIQEIDKISDNFNVFIQQIRQIISQVKEDADALAVASNQLKTVTSESESVTAQQRTQTNIVASSIRQLSDSIQEISVSAHDTSSHSLEAQESLRENMQRAEMAAENIKLLVTLLQDSSDVISNLKREVNEITNMLDVITSIADQTNLLALNAAIEAARAGDAGRGFSVVADEVRALAKRSQENTEQIAKVVEVMTDSSQKSVDRMERAATAADGGIHLVDLVSTAMDELNANLERVMDMTTKVSSTTDYQNTTSDSVINSVNQINKMAQEVEQGAHQTSESATKLANIAQHAQQLVARFKV